MNTTPQQIDLDQLKNVLYRVIDRVTQNDGSVTSDELNEVKKYFVEAITELRSDDGVLSKQAIKVKKPATEKRHYSELLRELSKKFDFTGFPTDGSVNHDKYIYDNPHT